MEQPVVVRTAGPADAARLLRWRNDPAVRAASRSRAEVSEAEHRRWLATVLADPERHLLVAEVEGEPIGQVRFDRLDDARHEISVALAPEARGRRLAAALIEAGIAWLREHVGPSTVDAVVRHENEPSLRAFRRAGFADAVAEGEFVRLRREV